MWINVEEKKWLKTLNMFKTTNELKEIMSGL